MKMMITIIGIMITLAGILPFLKNFGLLPQVVPTDGAYYSIVIIAVGALGLIYGIINRMIMGVERVVTVSLAALTILGGVLPLISSLIPNFIPTSGPFYSAIIIVIGVIGVIYGVLALG